MEWRLQIDPPASGAWNMAVDEVLAEAVGKGTSLPTLRLYRWQPPCLSLGFSQPWGVADDGFCQRHGVDVVRRATGGRAVLHHLELTYSVTAPLGKEPFSNDLQNAYQSICRALVAGLRSIGAPAQLAAAQPGMIKPTEAIPCFVGPATGEVVVKDRKLVGSAMRRWGKAILQHGSILEDWDSQLQAGCLGLVDDSSLRPAVVTLADLLGTKPEEAALANAIAAGFCEVFKIELCNSQLSEEELAKAEFLTRERYAHERWTVCRSTTLPTFAEKTHPGLSKLDTYDS